MKVFIPSKNRASQLHLLVESLQTKCINLKTDIHVLYTTDSKEYDYGYDLFKKHNPNITMEYETCFESDFWHYLTKNQDKHIMLLTDDCVFYRDFAGENWDIINLMAGNVWCFSFRLGLNTTTQWYRTGQQQDHLGILGYDRIDQYIKWNWKIRQPFENYGYMMSWDGHVYRGKNLLELSKKFSYYNPRTFEDRATKVPEYRACNLYRYMVAPELSCLFVNTINAVQEEPPPFGSTYTCSPAELNERYLNGEIIDLSTFDGLELNSSHEEIPLKFRKV